MMADETPQASARIYANKYQDNYNNKNSLLCHNTYKFQISGFVLGDIKKIIN